MRLLFVCPDMRTGGAERHWASLIPELHERQAVEAKLVALGARGELLEEV